MTLWMAVFLAASTLPAPFEQDGKWGYKDSGGKVVIAPRYDAANEFSPEGLAAVADRSGWAYIDKAGRVVIRPLVVDNGPDDFQDGLARFASSGKIGFFDRNGRIVIPPRHSFAMPFSEGLAAVCDGCREVVQGEHKSLEGGRWGYIDRSGKLAIPLQYEAARSFEGGRAKVTLRGKWVEIDARGGTK